MKKIILSLTIQLSILSILFCTNAFSQGDLTGRELAQLVYDRDIGQDSTADMIMELINKKGKTRVRTLKVLAKKFGKLQKTFLRFLSPPDIAGTGFLTVEKKDGDSEQFLYLPTLKRARRIAISQRGRRFVNTDFAYEDMERRPVDKYEHKILGSEEVDGLDCWILQSKPKRERDSSYSLFRSLIIKDIYVPVKIDYFNKKNKHWKTYQVIQLENIQNIWTETQVIMTDLIENHKTIITTKHIVYNTMINDSIFTVQNLENW